ncbi:hypothetical protein EVG20_g5247 [Dentipellis fragilis]|uniref:Zn(2)-C6 fungal-type domain-containing protein n=1 Tax=Dentipellis fragilis TaxID=205917 RepID=A0A4Y9YXJ5_9AGAM|nr:hypothetical protein EVG20_g5247 [Dentipellis fragilis]
MDPMDTNPPSPPGRDASDDTDKPPLAVFSLLILPSLIACDSAKTPVVRGARACTVCRAAKMKCVGAEDGTQPCQRCRRSNSECIFEKHRRGRKPGSKLSEASKMLRRLEKGLSSAKLKQVSEASAKSSKPLASGSNSGRLDALPHRLRPGDPYGTPGSQYSTELPPLGSSAECNGDDSRHGPRNIEEQDDDGDRGDEGMFPAKLIRRENQRQPFFKTILNPEHETPVTSISSDRATSSSSTPPTISGPHPPGLEDPVAAGIVDEAYAKVLFDLVFLRLNPFINLFDPALHSVAYVRSKSPFLFTTLIMAGCKFFKPVAYKACQKLAHEFAVRAFAEGWKSVEVVQAFACLTYWKEPDDTRTWTYIGYACRMAVELCLNRYVPSPPINETDLQLHERRNRERTYLVLFVHDRSLSMQTGRQWMLPEDDLVRHSTTWHEEGSSPIRPEDVIVAAFVQLRRLAAEPTDVFYLHKGVAGAAHNDVNQEVLLRNCNGKLTQWMETWQHEMRRANGELFHFAFLSFFRLHVRLFLNSFGIQASMSPQSRTSPSLQALSACYTSALENLSIVAKEFASMSMLRYGQDSITVATAYSAVFLLKLLRSSNTLAELHEGATNEIHSIISKTADAYEEASSVSLVSSSAAAYHARFLRGLVAQDIFKARQNQSLNQMQGHGMEADKRSEETNTDIRMSTSHVNTLSGNHVGTAAYSSIAPPQSTTTPPQMYPQRMVEQEHSRSFHFPASPRVPAPPPPLPSYRHPSGSASGSADLGSCTMRTASNSGPKGNSLPQLNYSPQGNPETSMYAYPTPAPATQAYRTVQQPPSSELDMRYWNNMFRELGFGDNIESTQNQSLNAVSVYAHSAAVNTTNSGPGTAAAGGIRNGGYGSEMSSVPPGSGYGRNPSTSYASQGHYAFSAMQ